MTVRQIFYQLVSRQVVENSKSGYHAVSDALVGDRKDGTVPWAWIEDRNRRPRTVSMWGAPSRFLADVVAAYRGDV